MTRHIDWARFENPEKAKIVLDRVLARLGPRSSGPLAALLLQSPDSSGVLRLLDRYVQVASSEIVREIGRRPTALTYLAAAFGFGGSMAEALIAEPALAVQFARDRGFLTAESRDDLAEEYARLAATQSLPDIAQQLGRFKRRHYVRIALKDVLGFASLAETTLELSALADVILAQALLHADRELQKRFGEPQYRDAQGRVAQSGFSIISLGKLGGNELNYSSDIDLLFLYARDGETSGLGSGATVAGNAVSNKEYFVRAAQAVTQTLTEPTAAGQAYRVDLRLRPEGDQGDLTLALDAALDYYGHRARDWELQMLIKARHSAGDARLTRAFLRGVEPFVYSSPADPAAVVSVLLSRARITQSLHEDRPDELDVKLHPGGIRDVEFLTQCLQRLYGAREPWVRSGGTLHALRKLNDKDLLSDRDYAALTAAYEFLRGVEHRIQLDRGRQSHRLPRDPAALDLLARRVGVDSGADAAPGAALRRRLDAVMSEVQAIGARLISPSSTERAPLAFELKPPMPNTEVHHYSQASLLRVLEGRAPEVARLIREAALPSRARPRVARLMAAMLATPDALDAAREHPKVLERTLEALRVSEHIGSQVVRHLPDLAGLDAGFSNSPASSSQLDMKLESGHGSAPEGQITGPDSGPLPALPFAWTRAAQIGFSEALNLLRREYHLRSLALAVNDCAMFDNIFAALGRCSGLAAMAVATAFSVASRSKPATEPDCLPPHPPLAVLALGRLGLSEFDLGSDVDLFFVVPSGTPSDGLAAATRVAERTIDALSSYTKDGVVFAVDTRLRPHGLEGELVVAEDALFEYVLTAAQPWEALTYLKICPVAGDWELGRRATTGLSERIFQVFAGQQSFASALRDMRRRLEKEVRGKPAPTKTSAGGYYDVDFAVSYLRICHRLELPAGSNIRVQIEALAAAGVVAEADAATLVGCAAFLRSLDHAVRLVTGRASRGWRDRPGQAEGVTQLLRHWRLLGPHAMPLKHLEGVQQQTRDVFDRLIGRE
jgi:[glutamine synthetase] adenylyltransferase / [glutamine synthetase]-adenylyl-L-tyrosine phosphorylase